MQSRAQPHQGRTALLDRPGLEVSFAPLGQSALAEQQGCRHATLLEGSTALQGHRLLCYVRRGVTAPGAERRLLNVNPILAGLNFLLLIGRLKIAHKISIMSELWYTKTT